MKYRPVQVTTFACCVAALSAGVGGQPQKLYAPGYYIAVSAVRENEGVIKVHGATNLPVDSKIDLVVEDLVPENGRKALNSLTCAAVDQRGLFSGELHITKEAYQKKDLIVDAIFLTNECPQEQKVLQIVGVHGEYLGNDTPRATMEQVEKGMTRGMADNPQIFQISGWYFGVASIARLD